MILEQCSSSNVLKELTRREDPLHIVLFGHVQHWQHGAQNSIEERYHPINYRERAERGIDVK